MAWVRLMCAATGATMKYEADGDPEWREGGRVLSFRGRQTDREGGDFADVTISLGDNDTVVVLR